MMRNVKYMKIFNDLRAQLVEGKYSEKSRLPSEMQLVRKYGVSRPTVVRALKELQAAGFIERRAGAGTFARRITESDSGVGGALIGLIVPGMGVTEIFDVICGKLIGLARTNNYSVVWGSTPLRTDPQETPAELAESFCQEMIERKVQGVFFAPFGWQSGQAQINRLIAGRLRVAGIPIVLLDRDVAPFPQRSDYDLVGIDNFAAGYTLTKHLLDMGCRRLFFVAGTQTLPTVEARYAGFREAMLAHGITANADPCPSIDPADEVQIAALLKNKPDAFVCANDYRAGVLMQTLDALGCNVPQDVRIVGFDDVKYATLLRAPLTTMHQPCREIAAVAWQVMQNRLKNPTLPTCTVSLAARLVVRQSCGAYLPTAGRQPD
ncbi:MAG TPA: GntR family transcriptional regulator [Kiritimatiellia bacterium]|nr:GntR family transcriptional regulator [Kiritimatiellia bacterium]